MAVITISRQLGSGGTEIARKVAQSLGYEYVDKQTIEAIFRQYGLTKFDEVYTSTPGILDLIDQDNMLIVSMLNEMLDAVAKRGNVVIVGRGGFAVLGDYADVLKVRVEAELPTRVERVVASEDLQDAAAAQERIAKDDEMHGRWVRMFYNKRWDDPANFDMVIDTSTTSFDAAAAQIMAAAQEVDRKAAEPGAVLSTSIEVDRVLADAVAKAIANPLPAASPDRSWTATG